MCGIAGILVAPGGVVAPGALDAMTDALLHRGPDARGVFAEPARGVYLGHRRLSILDLSPSGSQPMESGSGRYVIVLNGEIYNFAELRARLDAERPVAWRGTSDTEVLAELCDRYGVETALECMEGMYAIAVWCRDRGELVLARDRFGEKPLFIAETPAGFLFASELKAILANPSFTGDSDETAVDLFLQLSYIPEPLTPFLNVRKLLPGHFAVLRPGQTRVAQQPYWSAATAALKARVDAVVTRKPAEEIVREVEARLEHVVARQMVADVPVGAFLSGGIDSSLVVALMQRCSPRPVRTFTIGFKDEAYDEAPYARAIAKHLGTQHTEAILDWREALDLIDKLPEIYSEPFGDSSQLPTYLVSRVARRDVTVCLSGDGGDEVFGGYNRHAFALHFERSRAWVPHALRSLVGGGLRLASSPRHAGRLRALQAASGLKGIRILAEKLDKLGGALQAADDTALYASLIRRDDGRIAGTALTRHLAGVGAQLANRGHSLSETMMLLDTLTYLPGDILTKVDRAAMAVSLETRIPYLDHEVFALAWSLPIEQRIKNGRTKSALRGILSKHVPNEMFERPKAGFGVPIDRWLREPLSDWIGDQVASFSLAYPRHAVAARGALSAFRSGQSHAHHFLWNVAALEGWRRAYAGKATAPFAMA